MNIIKYLASFSKFYLQACRSERISGFSSFEFYPRLNDDGSIHDFDKHYVYFNAWAARKLILINPKKHIDISSFVHFSSICSAFVSMEFYDYRKLNLDLENLKTGRADLTKLPFKSGSIKSLSCMHVVEHIGLGRYGDKLDADGDLKALSEIKRVIARGGDLLFVVPVGKPKVVFNAHRIYSYDQIIRYFEGFSLMEFSLIPEGVGGGMIVSPPKRIVNLQKYGCGCFWFKKL
jgi:hypothetical protein